MSSESQARENIDHLLTQSGWYVCDADKANIHASLGVAIREFPLPGYGFADYLLYVDGKAAGVVVAEAIEEKALTCVAALARIKIPYYEKRPSGHPRSVP